MTRMTSRMFVSLLFVLIMASVANAQATRTWVSGVGDDVNPCSRTAPCKTFAGAISRTAEGGEISVLDPGGFGALTITKAITINGEGTLGSILNAGSIGINVNVTTNPATATVYIHGISINGANTGTTGINYTAGNTLVVDHCWIYGQTTTGINVNGAGDLHLKVNDTEIEHITAGNAITLNTSAGQAIAMISRCYLQDAVNGIEAKANVRAGVSRSVITHNSDSGIKTTGNDSTVNIDDIFISVCTLTGLKTNNAGTPSHIRVSNTVVTQNGRGIDNTLGGTIDSFQGNSVYGNGLDGLPFDSTTLKQ